ncbi:acyltransferase family protein [Alicyclobacillus suci]|uniref:acyltransferase family protein n=1 Tax=Alicyclobacillus suci TaxID=2816080 RepID=UPI001A8DF2F8|nr:acyltransferase family protein [Alicyclobacillus suci]
MPKPLKGNSRYMPGLDGLRALAVLAVIGYHLNLGFVPGGLLGVGVFFVLSGYLITDLLVAQWRNRGRLNLRDFWWRRARRLLPGMVVMLLAVLGWVTLFDRTQLTTVHQDALASVLYVSNWWFIFHKVSYFASFGRPSPLGHLWSLAVEEQFYLVWPLLLAMGLACLRRRWRLLALTLVVATASAVAMAVIYQPGTDPSRVYYGTDTRAFGLLIGAALALVWPSAKLTAKVGVLRRTTLELSGALALAVVLYMMVRTNEYDPLLYRGGLVLLSVASAVVVAVLAHPASSLGKVLGWRPLRWLGVRSYGIYLWHYPVIVLTSPAVNTGGVNVTRDVLQVVASIGLAALSWRYLEEPIRQGALARLWTALKQLWATPVFRWSAVTSSVAAAALFTVGVAEASPFAPGKAVSAVSTSAGTPVSDQATTGAEAKDSSASAKTTGLPVHSAPQAQHASDSTGTDTGSGTNGATASAKTGAGTATTGASGAGTSGAVTSDNPQAQLTPIGSGTGITTIGDSVMVDATPDLQKLLPGIICDGQIGRQLTQASATVSSLKANGQLGDRIVIELGTNGPFTANQLTQLLQSLGPVKQIVLVNTRVPRPWESVVNATLAQVAKSFPHTTLVDWYTASAGHSDYFYPDGVHLNPTGAEAYAELLAHAIAQ